MEDEGASVDEIREILGRGRAKKGIFEGDLSEGELEIGQIASSINSIISAQQVVERMIEEFNETGKKLSVIKF
jgi:enoyl-[acyl-carrier protein] reductase II